MDTNLLYYGDNLDVLRRHVDANSIDLVYLDPPFNSNATYNVLFAEKSGAQAAAQIKAFEDTWHWDEVAARAFEEVVEEGGKVAEAMRAFTTLLGPSDMLAYLSMMAPRLKELRRVLKPTGSIYLHCDPTASHYLKLLMDAVFGPENFRSEIIWKRTHAHGGARRYGPVHDTLLFYSRTDDYTWVALHTDYSADYLDNFFRFRDPDGRRYRATILTGSGRRGGDSGKPWRGIDPTAVNRHWAVPGFLRGTLGDPSPVTTQEALERLDAMGRVLWPAKAGGTPSLKQYEDDMEGAALQDVWTDIPPLSAQARERLGYPTQKPVALLQRILGASSRPGDRVLDPFCGCGTTIAAAQDLKREWIGIDITHLAIGLIKHRLHDSYGGSVKYDVIGEPTSVPDAEQLAHSDPYQFQWWALGLVGARPADEKKGADHGIDGRLYFHDEAAGAKTKQIVISVKAGHVTVSQVRDLRGVIDREKAEIGVLLSFEDPTQPMRAEAAGAGFYKSLWGTHACIQLLTIGDLLAGKKVDMPPPRQTNATYQRAPKAIPSGGKNLELPIDGA